MVVFACASCGEVLTTQVAQVALPGQFRHQLGNGKKLPAFMEAGTYAVDPEPSGPPWKPWSEIGADEAEARGVYAPVDFLSFGTPGEIAIAPGDVRGTVLIPDRLDGYCCGLDGSSGPNLACEQCGLAVATRIDDCSLWQAVWFEPDAVQRIPVAPGPDRPTDWATVVREWEGVAPVEPPRAWSPLWRAAVGEALAYLVAASSGSPVVVPDGLVATTFGRAIEALLPSGPAVKVVGLAGPDLPVPDTADIALVPRHPQTGESWQPPGTVAAVPLTVGVWLYLAFSDDRLLLPASGGLPLEYLRDVPPPIYPRSLFPPDREAFLHTLARLPAVREPWLRRIYDRVKHSHPF